MDPRGAADQLQTTMVNHFIKLLIRVCTITTTKKYKKKVLMSDPLKKIVIAPLLS